MALDYYYASRQSDRKKGQEGTFRKPQILTQNQKEKKITVISYRRLSWVLVLLGLVYLAWWILVSPVFSITKIEYASEPSERVKSRIETLKGKNIVFLRSNDLARQWEAEQPSIKALHIYRGLPHTLRVTVEERSKAFIWQTQGKSYLLDGSGVAYEEIISPEQNSFAIIDDNNLSVTLGKQIVSHDFVKNVQTLLDDLPGSIAEEGIKNIHVGETTFNITVVTGKDIKIFFDMTQPLDLQMEAVKKIYAENRGDVREYLDVRVIGKAYIK
jgi:cell division septal protein FtsQ